MKQSKSPEKHGPRLSWLMIPSDWLRPWPKVWTEGFFDAGRLAIVPDGWLRGRRPHVSINHWLDQNNKKPRHWRVAGRIRLDWWVQARARRSRPGMYWERGEAWTKPYLEVEDAYRFDDYSGSYLRNKGDTAARVSKTKRTVDADT